MSLEEAEFNVLWKIQNDLEYYCLHPNRSRAATDRVETVGVG